MSGVRTVPILLLALAASALADGSASPREALLRSLDDETAAVREDACRTLERTADLTEAEVRAALATAGRRTKPYLLRVAASRGLTGLVPEAVAALSSEDPVVTDAAVRALVRFGDDAVASGLELLEKSKDEGALPVASHQRALTAQRTVERQVVAGWRRKGGQYLGRYKGLANLGWPVQPVLLAMLLDVPLSDRHLDVPALADPAALKEARRAALMDLATSTRRGYRTFEPLPPHIEEDELFDLAAQALKDVGDVDLMGDILEAVASALAMKHESAPFRLRQWEKAYYVEIDTILFNRDRPERLLNDVAEAESQARQSRAWLERGGAARRADQMHILSSDLSDWAGLLHQIREYDEAASVWTEVIRIGRELSDKDPAIAGYNRACALARGGRLDEAMKQLARALDRGISSGTEDLTREWVAEDGDLIPLHDDPRWAALMKRHFGEDAAKPPDGVKPAPPAPAGGVERSPVPVDRPK
jgi:tetratricopeptide (TPR) repeat protein